MELTSGPFTFRIGSCQVVILSGGGAGGRDLTSADRFDVVDGNAAAHEARGISATVLPIDELRRVPRRACALLRMTARNQRHVVTNINGDCHQW